VIDDGNFPTPMPTYAQIQWQLATLNAAFSNSLASLDNVPAGPQGSDVKIQFCLAKYKQVKDPTSWPNATPGVMHYTTTNQAATIVNPSNFTSYNALASLTNYNNNFPPSMYLNIFCVPQINPNPGATISSIPTIIGIGNFPWMSSSIPFDGILMRADCIGNNTYGAFPSMYSNYDKGNILVHEAGHYLGLLHTFETVTLTPNVGPDINSAGTGNPGCYGLINPTQEGDLIFDTPPTNLPWLTSPVNSCNESYAPYGLTADEFDQCENFMYYNEDENLNTFTYNQAERMWGAMDASWNTFYLNGQRANLSTSNNLNATGVSVSPACGPMLFAPEFNTVVDLLSIDCNTASVSFVTPNLPGFLTSNLYTWDFGDGSPVSTSPNPTHVYNIPPNSFVVTVTVTNGVTTVVQTTVVNIPTDLPSIVGQSGNGFTVCNGSEQTILVRFPPGFNKVLLSDGVITYTVLNNFVHNCSWPANTYIFPFTFTVTSTGNWSIKSGCGSPSAAFTVTDCCNNMVCNGEFEFGTTCYYSDYTLTNWQSTAFIGVPWWGGGGLLFVDSDMWNTFPAAGCKSPGARKILVGQQISGLQFGLTYYLSFKAMQSFDSIGYCAPNKFNLRLFNNSGTVINQNCLPSTVPHNFCPLPGGTGIMSNQIFNFTFSPPLGTNSSTQFSLELSEVDNSQGQAFDYVIDNLNLQRMGTPPMSITPGNPTVCLGNSVQLNGMANCGSLAGYNLSWLPATGLSCYNCSNPICTPGVNTIYTLTATPPSQLLPVLVQTVVVYVASPPLSLINPTPVCYPATFTLNVSGVSSVVWQPGNYTGFNYVVSAPGIYTATAISGACTMVGTVSVVQLFEDLYVGGGLYCTNATDPFTLTSQYYPLNNPGATYTWQPGNIVGASVTVAPTIATTYTVYVTTPGGCSMQRITVVTPVFTCCPQGYGPLLTGTDTGGTVTGPKIILTDITIGGPNWTNTEFTGDFLIGPNVKITIKPNREFRLNGAHLHACGTNMWQGVVVEDGAAFLSNNYTLIEDAITAVDASNISAAKLGLVIEVWRTTFNRNYISVKVSNNIGINSVQIYLCGNVFTSRALPFTATGWPQSSAAAGGLRYTTLPTTDIITPYSLLNYAPVSLKLPYNNQPAHIGVQVSNFGNTSGAMPSAGVILNKYPISDGPNIFDNLGTGIDISNANVTANNNVFQNLARYTTTAGITGGTAIRSNINSQMNAGLYLSPPFGDLNFKNYFWDCYTAVDADNVYQLDADNLIVRSTQNYVNQTPGAFLRGNTGITYRTNRFNSNIRNGDYNNIMDAVKVDIVSGGYNIGGPQTGVYAGNFDITGNYFGAEVNSLFSPLPTEFMNSAIIINANPAAAAWNSSNALNVNSNRVDRASNAILLNGMNSHPSNLIGNNIFLRNDVLGALPQYGIKLLNTKNSVMVSGNSVRALGTSNTNVSSIYCDNNVGSGSPQLSCNNVKDSYAGFTFSGSNPGTVWRQNKMSNQFIGLLLTNNGVMGQQGNPGTSIENQWSANTLQTYVNNSTAALSKLFVKSGTPFNPTVHGSNILLQDYGSTSNVFVVVCCPWNVNCPSAPPAPMYKENFSEETALLETVGEIDGNELQVFPNPASNHVIVRSVKEKEELNIRLLDVTGKLIFAKQVSLDNNRADIDFDLLQGVYFLEIFNGENRKTVSKLVINK